VTNRLQSLTSKYDHDIDQLKERISIIEVSITNVLFVVMRTDRKPRSFVVGAALHEIILYDGQKLSNDITQ